MSAATSGEYERLAGEVLQQRGELHRLRTFEEQCSHKREQNEGLLQNALRQQGRMIAELHGYVRAVVFERHSEDSQVFEIARLTAENTTLRAGKESTDKWLGSWRSFAVGVATSTTVGLLGWLAQHFIAP